MVYSASVRYYYDLSGVVLTSKLPVLCKNSRMFPCTRKFII
jgi:hypothetical protein